MTSRLITLSSVQGALASNAVRQHPFKRPEGLFDVVAALGKWAETWGGIPSCRMERFESPWHLAKWIAGICQQECQSILVAWNTPKSGHTGPDPDDDFIDLDALFRNAAHDAWREAELIDDVRNDTLTLQPPEAPCPSA